MERVIVLSMFKTLVNRLFGPDEEMIKMGKDDYVCTEKKLTNRKKTETKENPHSVFRLSQMKKFTVRDESTREREYQNPLPLKM